MRSIAIFLLPICFDINAGEGFDRLFTTAKQRAYLDRNRHQLLTTNVANTGAVKASQGSNTHADVNEPSGVDINNQLLFFRGVIKTSNGKQLTWINNYRPWDKNVNEFIAKAYGGNTERALAKQNLLPGQIYHSETGKIYEAYEKEQLYKTSNTVSEGKRE